MTTNYAGHVLGGTHAARPAANTVPEGAQYACTDHGLIYQSDGAAWADWHDPADSAPASHTHAGEDIASGTVADARVASTIARDSEVAAAVTGLLEFKGATDASGNPNYPAAVVGDAYVVSVAGKIGGASGVDVEIGDVYLAIADNAGGTQAAVGSSWTVLEHNLAGALLKANNLSDVTSAATARTNLGLGPLATLALSTKPTDSLRGDGAFAPEQWKFPVRVATTAAGTLASDFESGDTIDGIVLAANDRILIKNQAAGAENGIYTVNASGAPTRAADFDANAEVLGAAVYVIAGTTNGGKAFFNTNTSAVTLGTTALTFAALSGGAALTVEESDGSPSVSSVDKLIFPPGSVTDQGSGDVYVRDVPQAFIGCKVYRATAETITDTFLSFNTEDFDSDGFHDNVTNNTRLTIPAGMGGKYLLTAGGSISARARLEPFVNGANVRGPTYYPPGAGTGWAGLAVVLELAAGDYVQIKGNAGASVTYGGSTAVDQMHAELVKLDSGKVGAGIGCKAYHNTTEARNNQVASLNSEEFDTNNFHDNVTNNSRVTIPAGLGGKYVIVATSSTSSATAQTIVVRLNGSTNLRGASAVGDGRGFGVATVADLVAGDYVEILFPGNSTFGDTTLPEEMTTLSVLRVDSGSSSAPRFKVANSTAAGANQNCSTSFASLFSSQLTLSIGASVGDVLKFELTCMGNDSDGQEVYVDFLVNGTRIGDATNGLYRHFTVDNAIESHVVIAWRTVVSGDLSGGAVSVVPQVKNAVGTQPAILYNTPPAVFVVTNLGPVSA